MSVTGEARTWLALLSAAALAGWWLAPEPAADVRLVKPRRDAFVLPPLPRRSIDAATAALAATAPYWGAPDPVSAAAVAAAAAPPDARWRIAAVFGSPSRQGILVSFALESKPPVRLYVGDKLPSGHRIVRIEGREVCIEIGRKLYRLGVEQREP